MKRTIKVLLILLIFASKAYAQTDELKKFVDTGVELHDKGDYQGAIEQYKKALLIDPKSPLANYEISSTYFALKEYDQAIEHSNKVIAENSKYVDQAYIMKGSALDLMGKAKEAVSTYKEAIKSYSANHLLNYNLGFTLYNSKDYTGAEEALQKALTIKPSHASSHLLLGYLKIAQNNRVKALLALYNFLLLEPKSNRGKPALEILSSELKKGVTQENEKSTTITLAASKESEEFKAAELMLSLLEASKNLEKNEGKTEAELFADNTKSFFSVLGELKKNNQGFWWNYYVDFFYALANNNHVETFCYYISQSKEDEKNRDWLKSNKDKIDAFSKWYNEYDRKK